MQFVRQKIAYLLEMREHTMTGLKGSSTMCRDHPVLRVAQLDQWCRCNRLISTFIHRSKLILFTHVISRSDGLSSQMQRSILSDIFNSALSILSIEQNTAETPDLSRLRQCLLWADRCRAAFSACFAMRRLHGLPSPIFLAEPIPPSKTTLLNALSTVQDLLIQTLPHGFNCVKIFVLLKAVTTSTQILCDDPSADVLPATIEAADTAAKIALEAFRSSEVSSDPSAQTSADDTSAVTPGSRVLMMQNTDPNDLCVADAIDDLPLLDYTADYGWFDDFVSGEMDMNNAQLWGATSL